MQFDKADELAGAITQSDTPWHGADIVRADFDGAAGAELETWRKAGVTPKAPFFLFIRTNADADTGTHQGRVILNATAWSALMRQSQKNAEARAKAAALAQAAAEKRAAKKKTAPSKGRAGRKAKGATAGKARPGNENGHYTDYPGAVPAGTVPAPDADTGFDMGRVSAAASVV